MGRPGAPCNRWNSARRSSRNSGLDHLQDVLLGRVVRALGAAVGRLQDRLEQRPEDGRRDRRPVELPCVEQHLPHRGIEVGDAERFSEQFAVHVRKALQILIERLLTPVRRRVENLEEPHEPETEVCAISGRAFLNKLEEDVARLEDPSVVGEEAEHGPDQEQLQVMAVVAGGLERIVQARESAPTPRC